MSPLIELRWTAQRELSKSFRSAKGIVLLLVSLLGGTVVAEVLAWASKYRRDQLGELAPAQLRDLREQAMTPAFGDGVVGKALADAPEVLLVLFFLTAWVAPLLGALLGFDIVAADLQHRTVRYFTLRTRRASYFVGKWLGLFGTVSIMTLTLHALVWTLCIVRAEATSAVTLGWGPRLWLTTLPMSAVWCAIATLVSSMFKTPRVALLATFAGFFFLLWVLWLNGEKNEVSALIYLYPNAYETLLAHPHVDTFAKGLLGCLGLTTLYLGAGSFAFARRDL